MLLEEREREKDRVVRGRMKANEELAARALAGRLLEHRDDMMPPPGLVLGRLEREKGHHDATKLPVAMLGHAGGKIKGGQNLDYLDNPNRQMCRLYLSMMDKMGVHLDKFGDATTPLPEV